ncbi:protein SCO1/2 [Roseovarius halotolerans]|uniref:SCO1/SenC n=1 Tax=Roseovarius halotolerans TaxID=505353 RepID=A0A1X6Z4N2_9RHOB|nr:SCO family protein [Roseovarius halotolerans]RKT32326.1 protein SCO1/2 [Roseovarius halotolerans]SLN38724.1 SCO1/SenC [Roseovarius halotolerans]
MTRMIAIAAAAVLVAALAAHYFLSFGSGGEDRFAQCREGKIGGGAKIGGPFTLVDENGETVTDEDVIDQPTLLYFGYTFCPDVCPLDMSRNIEAVEVLEERGRMVKPVFISIDPDRDTPEMLTDFTDNLHPRLLGLTGSSEQVRAASQAYRTYYQKQEPAEGDEDYYLVDHSTFTYLALPEIGFVEFFRRDIGPDRMADRVECFLDAM